MTEFIVNHVWQSSCAVLFAALLNFALRSNSPKIRYWVWLSASLKFLVPFALLVSMGSLVPQPPSGVTEVVPVFSNTLVQISAPYSTAPRVPAESSQDWVPFSIGVVWVLGFLAITLGRYRDWLRVRATLRGSDHVALPIPILAVIVSGVAEPGIVGFLRPVLVLPAQLLERLDPEQLSAILTHEMCHVRRRDNVFAAVHMVVEAVFWFNPLVWWVGSRMVEERELACDEEVLRAGCEPTDYVEGILKVCRFCKESPLPCISGVTGADVKKRLLSILAGRISKELSMGKKALLAASGLTALAVPIAIGVLVASTIRAQSPPADADKFEVASIKRNVSGDRGRYIRPSIGHLSIINMPVKNLITYAYQVHDFQISGGPSWLSSEYYNVEAKAESAATPKQMEGVMLRVLLEDRFQLRVRHETKELPIYELRVVNESKLRPSSDKECIAFDPGNPLLPSQGQSVSDMCGYIGLGRGSLTARQVDLSDLAMAFSQVLGRPVVDKTGITRKVEGSLKFDPAIIANSPDGFSDPTLPSIFTAVEEQLGLKLESARGPVDVLVIERAERPSEN
ncbi:MAG: M56 family metallopeptidase [Bryobacteraceae bacterium]